MCWCLRVLLARRAQPAHVSEDGFDAGQRRDDCGGTTLAVGPTKRGGEVRNIAQGVVGAQDGANHDKYAGGKHYYQDGLAFERSLELDEHGNRNGEQGNVGSRIPKGQFMFG